MSLRPRALLAGFIAPCFPTSGLSLLFCCCTFVICGGEAVAPWSAAAMIARPEARGVAPARSFGSIGHAENRLPRSGFDAPRAAGLSAVRGRHDVLKTKGPGIARRGLGYREVVKRQQFASYIASNSRRQTAPACYREGSDFRTDWRHCTSSGKNIAPFSAADRRL